MTTPEQNQADPKTCDHTEPYVKPDKENERDLQELRDKRDRITRPCRVRPIPDAEHYEDAPELISYVFDVSEVDLSVDGLIEHFKDFGHHFRDHRRWEDFCRDSATVVSIFRNPDHLQHVDGGITPSDAVAAKGIIGGMKKLSDGALKRPRAEYGFRVYDVFLWLDDVKYEGSLKGDDADEKLQKRHVRKLLNWIGPIYREYFKSSVSAGTNSPFVKVFEKYAEAIWARPNTRGELRNVAMDYVDFWKDVLPDG